MSLGNALLGLLNHRPMTGYDLKKIFDDPLGFFWVAQMSQIYRELNKLEEKGFVKSEIVPQEKRPDRKVYQLTKEGRETFLNWLNKFPDQLSQASRSRFLMRIFFSSQIRLDELAFEIRRYKKEKEEQLRYLNEVEQWIKEYSREKKFKEDAFYWNLIVKKGYKNVAAGIEWADECLQLIEQKKRKKGGN
jgi:DNA-binding PadR family transcriptional regulator